MKNTISILLALLILLQSFSKVWIFFSFKINQDFIAKELCINQDKPEVLCSGKCILTKNLRADEEQDSKQLPQKSSAQKEITYCFEMPQWLIVGPEGIVAFIKHPTFFLFPRSISYVMGVFHPPSARGISLRFS